MSKKIKKFRIDSIAVNKAFLEKLGNILEREITERDIQFNKSIEGANLTEYAIKIRKITTCKYHVNCNIVSNEEELEFSSMEELLSTSVFPQKIKSMSFRVSHFNTNFADISFTLDNDYDSIAKLSLSSEDESKILKIEKDIKDLFSEYKTKYNWIFKIPFSKNFMIHLLTVLFTIFGTRLLLRLEQYLFPNITKEVLDNSMGGIAIFLLITFYQLLNYLYPYYSFEMSDRSNLRKSIRLGAYTFFLALIGSAVYDLIKLFI